MGFTCCIGRTSRKKMDISTEVLHGSVCTPDESLDHSEFDRTTVAPILLLTLTYIWKEHWTIITVKQQGSTGARVQYFLTDVMASFVISFCWRILRLIRVTVYGGVRSRVTWFHVVTFEPVSWSSQSHTTWQVSKTNIRIVRFRAQQNTRARTLIQSKNIVSTWTAWLELIGV